MSSAAQRAARAAFDAARVAFDRLVIATSPDELATSLIEAWDGTEAALRALAGSSALGGLPLVRELRQRNLLSLDEAHALVDFHAAAERVKGGNYTPSSVDVATAQTIVRRLPDAFERDAAGAPAATPATGPISAAPGLSTPSALPPTPTPASRSNVLSVVVIAVAVAAIVGAGVYYAMRMRGGTSSELSRARAAYAAGDRVTAKNVFGAVTGNAPTIAEPHIYLGRIAREEGDMATAKAELTRAVELEPQNALALRELAAFLLANGQLDLARSFYERAIRLDPDDKNALGFMGCTLIRQGRIDVGQRFLQRAGPGEWQACASLPAAPLATPPAPGPR
jgi:tetratricopeptide (TPR) repeat protein